MRKIAWQLSPRFRRAVKLADTANANERVSFTEYLVAERHLLERNRSLFVAQVNQFAHRPLISIIVPLYNTKPHHLKKCLQSVQRQLYDHWELCLVDDGSTSTQTRRAVRKYVTGDKRIHLHKRTENGHIARATNDGIAMAKGEFTAFLDHDDELTEDALYHIVKRINEVPEVDVLYTDQDKINDFGFRSKPFFKPDWSPTYFRAVMYLGHLVVARTELIRAVGGCNPAFNGVQDFELALRLTERARRIEHIARIGYHWRTTAGSIAGNFDAKSNISILQQTAVQAQLDRLSLAATATPISTRHRIRAVPDSSKLSGFISIIICSKDAGTLVSRCLDSLYEKTQYPNFEVILGDNGTTDPVALDAFERHPIRRMILPDSFHFARFNNLLAAQAKGDYLLFLNNDTEILDEAWLDHLLFHASQQTVAAVGPLLTYPDGSVQHAGVILGPRGTADHLLRNFPCDSEFYHGILRCDHEVSAVTAACLLVATDKFREVGGFNENFRHHYEDVDLCLKLRQAGYQNMYAGSTRLVHHESKTRGKYYDYTDRMLLLDTWEEWIAKGDPFYNPNYLRTSVNYSMCLGGLLP